MGYVKRIVCLANSYKAPLGRCIAGKEISPKGEPCGGWIRPVSARPKGELSSWEFRYQDWGTPRILDIIDIPLLAHAPQNPQTENHVVDPKGNWKKTDELAWNDLEKFLDRPASLWSNMEHTREGHYDCMRAEEAAVLNDSLLLIKTEEFTVEAGNHGFGERRTYRGRFFYQRKYYNFSLTDPQVHQKFHSQQEGDYRLDDVYLSLSLTRPYEIDGRCHKLVAAVIAKSQF